MESETEKIAFSSNRKFVFAVVSDTNYIKYSKTFLRSLRNINSNIHVCISLIGFNNKKKIEHTLSSIYPNIKFFHTSKPNFKKSHERKAFAANHRVRFVKKLIHIIDESIFYLDVDSIIRGNVEDSLDLRKNFDISIIFRDSDDERFKVAAGAIFFKNNENSKRFINLWFNKISNIENQWFADQITFFMSFEELKENLNFKSLSKELNDWEFNPNSVIWSGKGDRKIKNMKYRIESIKQKFKSDEIRRLISKIQSLSS